MPSLAHRLAILRSCGVSSRRAGILAALAHASRSERRPILADLLWLYETTGDAPTAMGLLRHWQHLVPAEREATIDALRPGLAKYLSELIESDDPSDRLIGFRVVAACCLWLSDHTSAVGRLLRVDNLSCVLDTALADAAERYHEHRLPDVIDAVLARSAGARGRLRRFLEDTSQPAHLPLRAAAKALPDQAIPARVLVAWLTVPALSAVARESIDRRLVNGDEELLEQGHLLLAPDRAAAVGKLSRQTRVADSVMKEPAARGRIRWLVRLPMSESRRIEALAEASRHGCESARLDAVRALAACKPSPAGDEALVRAAHSRSEAPAWSAAAALLEAASTSRRRALAGLWDELAHSPHQRVRRIAAQARGREPEIVVRAAPLAGAPA